MGKTPTIRKSAPSLHSRAAKRATSPSIDVDKSLKQAKAPVETNYHPLGVHAGAGVTKKSKSGRGSAKSSKAKRRQEKALDRAEANMDRLHTKIEKSKGRARIVQHRAKGWEDHNRMTPHQAMLDVLSVEGDDNMADNGGDQRIAGEVAEKKMTDVSPSAEPATVASTTDNDGMSEEEIL